MDFLNNFGVDPILIIAQIVNFLIVLFILKRFLYKPIMDVLKKRQDSIERGLKQSEEAQKLMEEALLKEKDMLKKAQVEASEILNEAKKQSNDFLQEAKKDAKEQEKKILDEAKKQITAEVNSAYNKLEEKASSLAIAMVKKSANELLTEDDEKLVMKNVLQKLQSK